MSDKFDRVFADTYKTNLLDKITVIPYSIALQEVDDRKYLFHLFQKGLSLNEMPVICDSEGNPLVYTLRSQESLSDFAIYGIQPKNESPDDSTRVYSINNKESDQSSEDINDDKTKTIDFGNKDTDSDNKAKESDQNSSNYIDNPKYTFINPSEDPRFTEYDEAHYGKSDYNIFGEKKETKNEATKELSPEEVQKLLYGKDIDNTSDKNDKAESPSTDTIDQDNHEDQLYKMVDTINDSISKLNTNMVEELSDMKDILKQLLKCSENLLNSVNLTTSSVLHNESDNSEDDVESTNLNEIISNSPVVEDEDDRIITISNNLEDLDKEYQRWLLIPYDHKKHTDAKCLAKYGCTNTELYLKLRAQLLKNHKLVL